MSDYWLQDCRVTLAQHSAESSDGSLESMLQQHEEPVRPRAELITAVAQPTPD